MGFVCVLGHNLAKYNRPRNSGLKNGSYSSVHSAGQSSPCKGLNFFSALPSLKARRRKWWLEGQSNCWCSLKGVVGCVGMSMGSDSTWVGKKPLRRIGGMSDALSIASDLGFSVAAPPTQEELQNLSTTTGEKGDDLIKVLRELTSVQRKIADLQVELQGRKDDKNVAHLTHASEMEKKCETLARITTILKDVIQNKDRIIARLQQPYSLDCIPVEAEYQKQFSELLMKAASDYGALTASVADFQWSQTFKEPPSVWGEMLRPIPVALASCTRFFEAMSAMRESFSTLQHLRVGHSDASSPITPGKDSSRRVPGDSECVTPPPWRTEPSFDDLAIRSSRRPEVKHREADDENSEGDGTSHRRLSWPPSVKKSGV